MRSLIDFTKLDLRGAFDFAIMIEEDAQLRYEQLARQLGQDPGGAGDVFRAMVVTEGQHRDALVARREALFRGASPRIEISVVDDGPERPEVDDDDLPTTAREALEVALAAERRAEAFYAQALPHVQDPAVRAFFQRLMEEEGDHAALVERQIALEPPARPGAPRPQRPEATPERYVDRELLKAALPRFDAATQVVAASVLDGMAEREVAVALGVSRRTVSRKLTRFLVAARRGAAVTIAAATLAGFPPAYADSGVPARERDARAGVVQREDQSLAARIQAKVARRMARHDPSVRERVARAVLQESRRAGLDPVLVLALIHVESSFNPNAVSSAGAVGLMQLLLPTMRREMERSGLPESEPTDPVANVQAGVRYLRRLLDAFSGDLDTALMAYNAGPNRIRGHQRRGGIPERFHVYPQKVRSELERMRMALGVSAQPPPASLAAGEDRPRPLG